MGSQECEPASQHTRQGAMLMRLSVSDIAAQTTPGTACYQAISGPREPSFWNRDTEDRGLREKVTEKELGTNSQACKAVYYRAAQRVVPAHRKKVAQGVDIQYPTPYAVRLHHWVVPSALGWSMFFTHGKSLGANGVFLVFCFCIRHRVTAWI